MYFDSQKSISELRPGDLVDLCNDPFADKDANPMWESEYARVDVVEKETATCVAVYFVNGPCVGFPPDHKVRVAACPSIRMASGPCEFGAVEKELAASLACYVSPEDWGNDRATFLRDVRDRIDMDLQHGDY